MEYIALLEQMESGLHWEREIAWLPAKSTGLAAAAKAPATGSGSGSGAGAALCPRKAGWGAPLKFALGQNTLQVAHTQMFAQHSRRRGIFL